MKKIINVFFGTVFLFLFLQEAKGIEGPMLNGKASTTNKLKKHPLKFYTDQYKVAYKTSSGKVVKFEVLRKATNSRRALFYPYGEGMAKYGKIQPEMSLVKFNSFLKKQVLIEKKKRALIAFKKNKKSTTKATTTTPIYTTNIGLGTSTTTGYAGPASACYNATSSLGSTVSNTNFSSTNTASSFSGQTSASASISGAYDSFSASDSFTYENNYESSANAGQTFSNASVIYPMINVLDTSGGGTTYLNQAGQNANAAFNFSSTCGTEFLTAITVGYLITAQFTWDTSTSTNATEISNSTSGSYAGLDSISAAVSVASSSTNSSTTFSYAEQMVGGGGGAASIMSAAITANAQLENQCLSGFDVASCNSFATNMNAAAVSSTSSFQTTEPAYAQSTGDYSSFGIFPNGIQGVNSYTPIQSQILTPVPSDILGPYAAQLNNYITLMNQISTLNQRVSYLTKLLLGQNQFQVSQYFNPTPQLNITTTYLTPLSAAYSNDFNVMLSNLTTCMAATTATAPTASSTSVTTACAPILSAYTNSTSSAYEYYSPTGPSEINVAGNSVFLNMVQQNTIALQYTGTNNQTNNYLGTPPVPYSSGNTNVLVDAIWVSSISTTDGSYPYDSTPALLVIADYPWTVNSSNNWVTNYSAYTQVMQTTSSNDTMVGIPASSYLPQQCLIYNSFNVCSGNGTNGNPNPQNFSYTGAGCNGVPSFSQPCNINGYISFPSQNTSFYQNLSLAPIANFF